MTSSRSLGFTLTELVLVLLLVGIMATFAVPRLNIAGFEQFAFGRETANALRHAQKVAMGSGCHVRFVADAASGSFRAEYTGGGGTVCTTGALSHPSRGGSLTGTGGIASGGAVTFDGMGRTGNGLVITLEDGRSITVEAGSGYVRN